MKIWINLKKSYVIINVIEKKKENFMKLFQNN